MTCGSLYISRERLAGLGAELFGVIDTYLFDACKIRRGGETHRTHCEGAGQASTPHLIDSYDMVTFFPQFLLIIKMRKSFHEEIIEKN